MSTQKLILKNSIENHYVDDILLQQRWFESAKELNGITTQNPTEFHFSLCIKVDFIIFSLIDIFYIAI